MKRNTLSLIFIVMFLNAFSVQAQEKVVVIPLSGSAATHYYTLPGAVFVGNNPNGHNTDGTLSAAAVSYYYAPVILPNGAKLTEFVVYATNNSTSVADDVSLIRFDQPTAASTVMGTATIPHSTGTFTEFVAPSIDPDVIDNINYTYAVVIHSSDGQLAVSAVRITYISK